MNMKAKAIRVEALEKLCPAAHGRHLCAAADGEGHVSAYDLYLADRWGPPGDWVPQVTGSSTGTGIITTRSIRRMFGHICIPATESDFRHPNYRSLKDTNRGWP